jgi:glycosyltransferase involved in cell wall biosynthesis
LVSQTERDVRLGDTSTAVTESGTPPSPRARPSDLRRLAIVPAYNEEASVGAVIDEIRSAAPGFEIVVVDDGSSDRTAGVAEDHGAVVLRLPYNVGIGGAVQTGHQYAAERGFDLAIQIDGDGQHDPSEIQKLIAPLLAGDADMVVGTRFGGQESYRSSVTRRVGIAVLARVVSLLVHQRVTDPTSGFRAVNRRALQLFAGDYPHDYPEAEATVLVHRHHLRVAEVAVQMRPRAEGTSSISGLYSLVYMGKVLLALFVGLFRRYPQETG